MKTTEVSIPNETIEAVARSFFKETYRYGFNQVDYLKFVNRLLDMSLKNGKQRQVTLIPEYNYSDRLPKAGLPIVSDRVIIRKFDDSQDRALVEKWIEDQDGRYFLLSRMTAKRISLHQLLSNENNVVGVITLTNSKAIGLLAFLDFDKTQLKAELRKLIGEPEYRGKGLAKEATRCWIEHGFANLGLRKIYLNTLDTNFRNIRLNEELGFKVEGILRNECYFDGEYHDILRMSLIL